MNERKTIKNLALNIIRVALNLLFPLITFPYVSKILGPVNLGKVNFTSSVVNYFVLIASMGIPSYGVIVCAKARENTEKLKKTICELLYINIVLVVLAYFLFFASLLCVAKFQADRTLFLVQSISILLTAAGVDWIYSALEDFAYITIRSIIFKIISAALILILVKTNDDYILYAAILVLSGVGSCVLNLVHARQYIRLYPIKKLKIKQHMMPILTFFAASIAATISSNLDTTMLGFFKGDYEVGIYSFAVKIKNLLIMVDSAILAVFVPQFSMYAQSGKLEQYKKSVRLLSQMMFTFACVMSFFAVGFYSDVITILGGEQYSTAKAPLIILTLCLIVLSMTWTLGVGVLQPLGREKDYAKGITVSTVTNIIFNVCLIPPFGSTGAALATIISESVLLMCYWYMLKDFVREALVDMKWLVTPFCCFVAVCIAQIIRHLLNFALYYSFGISLFVYCLLVAGLVWIMNRELRECIKENYKRVVSSKANR